MDKIKMMSIEVINKVEEKKRDQALEICQQIIEFSRKNNNSNNYNNNSV